MPPFPRSRHSAKGAHRLPRSPCVRHGPQAVAGAALAAQAVAGESAAPGEGPQALEGAQALQGPP